MSKKLLNKKCFKLVSLLFILFFSTNFYSQCAGSSGSITICDKENFNGGANGFLDLNSIISGESAGGTWTETTALPCSFSGGGSLNSVTGLLNTWAIRKGCVYTYTYTCTTDGSTSTVTLTLGGYPGVGINGEVCNNDSSVNLFQFLGSNPNPDALSMTSNDGGGVFTCPLGPSFINGNMFDATLADPSDGSYPNYLITYTVPATATCPSRQTVFTITINPKAEPGTTIPLNLCETDDLSAYTAFDLTTLFNASPVRDMGGDWADETVVPFGNPSGGTSGAPYGPANGISNTADSTINIKAIYDAYVAIHGYDATHTDQDIKLTFTYTVYPTHPSCLPESKATFTVNINQSIDLNGALISMPATVCLNNPILLNINQNPLYPIIDGVYNITYNLIGANSIVGITTFVIFVGGTGTLNIDSTGFVAGMNTIEITNISNSTVCSRALSGLTTTFEIIAAPVVTATPTTETICSGETTNIVLSSDISGTTYTWTTISTNVSGANNGNGNSIQQTLETLGAITGNVVYTITPTSNGCTGTPTNVTIIVNPLPIVTAPSSISILSNESTNIQLTDYIPGTTFNWTAIQTDVTGASNGTGNIINQILTCTGTSSGTVIYTVTPFANGCNGSPIDITVDVIFLPRIGNGIIGTDGSGNVIQPYLLDTGLSDSNYTCEWTLNGIAFRGINDVTNVTTNQYSAINPGTYCVTATNSTTGFRSQTACADVTTQTLSTSDFNTLKLSFSPNPVSDILNISSKEILKKVTVFNTLGQMVYQNNFNDLNSQLNLSNLVSANYFVKVESDTKQNVIKIIKK